MNEKKRENIFTYHVEIWLRKSAYKQMIEIGSTVVTQELGRRIQLRVDFALLGR